ncbi:MAG: RND family transporter, partial [Epsilonproteobacteria bacterium]
MLGLLYRKFILKYPLTVLLFTLTVILLFGTNITKLEIDASAQTLLLDDDKDLKFLRTIEKRFKSSEMLIMAYKPKYDLLSPQSLETLGSLSNALETLPGVVSVDTLLSVPLLYSPPQDMGELLNKTRTLKNTDINLTLAKREFLTSPLYKDNLVNKDFTVSSILIHLKDDLLYTQLLEERDYFIQKQKSSTLVMAEKMQFEEVKENFKKHRDSQRQLNAQNIEDIRTIMKKYEHNATLFLGGVQMISNDIIGFVKSDLVIYGSILILLLIIVLGMIFKKPRWIVLPILICTLSVIAITSALGFWGWEITVISSNFIALQLIITISIVLHLIVRYQELLRKYPNASSHKLILTTMLSKATPTFFAILTTIAGFSSLLFSHIHPVINLGWMMSAGITLSFLISFIVFPSVLILLKKTPPLQKNISNFSLVRRSVKIVLKDKKAIFSITILSILFSITGASQLIVENSFINYFKKDTSIYRGMKIVDQELGGTTPLDVILTFTDEDTKATEEIEEDSFEDEFNTLEDEEQYWFTDEKIAIIHQVHNYLDNLHDTGDVQSFATILDTGKILNENKALDSVEIAILYKKLPQKYREIILSPYVSIEHNQVRFSTRIMDSHEGLRRNALIQEMNNDLHKLLNPEIVTFKLSNLMVMYNNMLQSLFTSQ